MKFIHVDRFIYICLGGGMHLESSTKAGIEKQYFKKFNKYQEKHRPSGSISLGTIFRL